MPYQLSPDARAKAEETVIRALESDVREERHLAAQAQLSHRLRNSFQRIDDRRAIDLDFISCAEYQMFLDEMADQGEWFHPDHWVKQRFEAGQAREPVKGLRPEDAEEFCRWLTQRQGGDGRYRLPTPDEASQFPAGRQDVAAWCRDSGEFVLVGLSPANTEGVLRANEIHFDRALPSICVMDVNRHREVVMFKQHLLKSLSPIQVVAFLLLIALVVTIIILIPIVGFILLALFMLAALGAMQGDEGGLIWLAISAICLLGGGWLILNYPLYVVPALFIILSLLSKRIRGFVVRGVETVVPFVRSRKLLAKARELEKDLVDYRKPDSQRLHNRELAKKLLDNIESRGPFGRVWRKLGSTNQTKVEKDTALEDVSWWLRVVLARENKQVKPWEGIRLVRVR